MFVRIANRKDPDQTASSEAVFLQKQSDLGILCLSGIFARPLMFQTFDDLPYMG